MNNGSLQAAAFPWTRKSNSKKSTCESWAFRCSFPSRSQLVVCVLSVTLTSCLPVPGENVQFSTRYSCAVNVGNASLLEAYMGLPFEDYSMLDQVSTTSRPQKSLLPICPSFC